MLQDTCMLTYDITRTSSFRQLVAQASDTGAFVAVITRWEKFGPSSRVTWGVRRGSGYTSTHYEAAPAFEIFHRSLIAFYRRRSMS